MKGKSLKVSKAILEILFSFLRGRFHTFHLTGSNTSWKYVYKEISKIAFFMPIRTSHTKFISPLSSGLSGPTRYLKTQALSFLLHIHSSKHLPVNNVVLVFLLLTLNIFQTFSSVPIVDFEHEFVYVGIPPKDDNLMLHPFKMFLKSKTNRNIWGTSE